MNKLVVIGLIGDKICYLNVSKEEAIERYCKCRGISTDLVKKEIDDGYVTEYTFDDEFSAYEVWG